MKTMAGRAALALQIAFRSGAVEGEHHKAWVIDQMVRALNGGDLDMNESVGATPEYEAWVKEHNAGEDGPDTYSWDEGTPP